MSEGTRPPADGTRTDDNSIEVHGCLSRTQWEIVYLAAMQFAQQQGLTIERFDLRSIAPEDGTSEPQPALFIT
jgi:hypothetical protein